MKVYTIILKTVDNTETFLGKISGGNISGKWISNDKNLYFNIWCENGDEYATGSGTNYLLDTDDIVYDSDNIYYSLNNCLYKSSYDRTYRSFYYVGRRTKCV